ncbi:MAG: hypothetical protein IJO65_13615 [Lachnospiraceae bacterium]|nr:hypothetical protein [Lachnospiraceae bacterium]
MRAEAKSKRKSNEQEEARVIYHEELPTEILDEMTEEQIFQYQIWDSITKRLLTVHPEMIFPLVRELFNEEYQKKTRITFLSREYTIEKTEKTGEKLFHSIRADLVFRIGNCDLYHIECQMKPDSEMVIRMFEYDTQIEIQHAITRINGEFVVTFPKSAILYLTHTNKTPDVERIRVCFPNGTYGEYTVPVMKVQNYSLSIIRDRELYVIIPLALVRFKKAKGTIYSEAEIKMLTDFMKEATLILEEAVNDETITEYQRNDILDYMFRAGKYLFRGDVNVLMRMDEYVPSFLKFQREIVADLQNEKKEWEAEREKREAEMREQEAEIEANKAEIEANKAERENSIKNFVEAECADGFTKEKCYLKIQKIFSLSEEDAKVKVDAYWTKND